MDSLPRTTVPDRYRISTNPPPPPDEGGLQRRGLPPFTTGDLWPFSDSLSAALFWLVWTFVSAAFGWAVGRL